MDDQQQRAEAAAPVDNRLPAANLARPEAERGGNASPLQIQMQRLTDQCTAYGQLRERLGIVLVAVRGAATQGSGTAPIVVPPAPKSPSWLDSLTWTNTCNEAVQGDIAGMVGELEFLLNVPRET